MCVSSSGTSSTVIVDVAVVLAVLVLVAGMCGIRNVSVHYLLTNQYYPYPKPTHYVARAVGMIAAWVVSGVLAGRVLLSSSTRLRTLLATLTVLAWRDRVTGMPTLG